MKLKAFLSSYLLFLCVLFIVVITISTYMTNSQINMIREKSTREYQTISASLSRDIAVAFGNAGGFNTTFDNALDRLVRGYIRYYSNYNIELILTEVDEEVDAKVTFIERDDEHFIHIKGNIHLAPLMFRLDYYLNISENMTALRNIQSMLLLLFLTFSALTAIGLYFILLRIFKPINIITKTSTKIADGDYNERITITGNNELSAMAESFNKMVDEIELQIVGKQQFIDNFTHEIRTPLTSIYGYAEYIQKAPYDEKTFSKASESIMNETKHITTIANSLLKLATLRDYVPINDEISVSDLFRSVYQAFNKNINIRFINDIDTLRGQEDLIKLLLINLCSNAIKANATDILMNAGKTKDGHAFLSVADNGCGIPAEEIAKITEPFYRIDKARSKVQGGVGLGLTLCKQIVKIHGADMAIESVFGEGTKITATFTTP